MALPCLWTCFTMLLCFQLKEQLQKLPETAVRRKPAGLERPSPTVVAGNKLKDSVYQLGIQMYSKDDKNVEDGRSSVMKIVKEILDESSSL